MSSGPEYELVEKPLIDQLQGMDWKYTAGDLDDPTKTFRTSFRDLLLLDDLKDSLRRLNVRDGAPWLDDARMAQACAGLVRIDATKLLEINQKATEVLVKGVPVEGIP